VVVVVLNLMAPIFMACIVNLEASKRLERGRKAKLFDVKVEPGFTQSLLNASFKETSDTSDKVASVVAFSFLSSSCCH
jgi:hypothetical protein